MMLNNLLTHVGILLVMLSRGIVFVNSDESDDAHYESDDAHYASDDAHYESDTAHYESDEYHDREDESNRDGELTRQSDCI